MIPLLFAAALQSEIVLQTNVIEKFSCGAGCHKKVEQLTPMVEIGDGWRKVKVKKNNYFLPYETRDFVKGGIRDIPTEVMGIGWNYSNCTKKLFTRRYKEYFSAPSQSNDNVGLQKFQPAFLRDGTSNRFVYRSIFQQWAKMCPETQAAKEGNAYLRGWHDAVTVINSTPSEIK